MTTNTSRSSSLIVFPGTGMALLLIGLIIFQLSHEVESFVAIIQTSLTTKTKTTTTTPRQNWNNYNYNNLPTILSSSNINPHASIVDADVDTNSNNDNADDVDNDDNNIVNQFYWDFRGHSCYAEIINSNSNSNSVNNGNMNKDGDNDDETTTTKTNMNIKPDILLIHGFACSTVYWRETKAYLTNAGYTVHSIDLLGQGKSSKPDRQSDNINYSINLWAEMVDDYSKRYINCDDVVLIGNSLGSVVALSAATGDWYYDNNDNDNDSNNNEKNEEEEPHLPTRIKGLCFYNVGIGMNSQNVLKTIPSKFIKSITTMIFHVLNSLIFDNEQLLTYVINNQVSKDTLGAALLTLYAGADDPESRVDDELINSFLEPVTNDSTQKIVEVIRQIYTNDAGKTPMELHAKYYEHSSKPVSSSPSAVLPMHLIWGDKDQVTPLDATVGQFYSKLAAESSTTDSKVDVSMNVINQAGHVPFDERPECNAGLIQWLNEKIII
jgi:pimeloyl-ACP methyl ester carboxylesterase